MTRRSAAELEAFRMLAWEQMREDHARRLRERRERVERGERVEPVARNYAEVGRLRVEALERGEEPPAIRLEAHAYDEEVPPPEVRQAVERRRGGRSR